MCQRKPGPRCASHARQTLDRALAALREELADPTQDPARMEAAVAAAERAQVDYNATATGYRNLTQAIENTNDVEQLKALRKQQRQARGLQVARQLAVRYMPSNDTADPADVKAMGDALDEYAYAAGRMHAATSYDQIKTRDFTTPVTKTIIDPADHEASQAVAEHHLSAARQIAAEKGYALAAYNTEGDTTTPVLFCDRCGGWAGSAHDCPRWDGSRPRETAHDVPMDLDHYSGDYSVAAAGAEATPANTWARNRRQWVSDKDKEALVAAEEQAVTYMAAHGYARCGECGQFQNPQVGHQCPPDKEKSAAKLLRPEWAGSPAAYSGDSTPVIPSPEQAPTTAQPTDVADVAESDGPAESEAPPADSSGDVTGRDLPIYGKTYSAIDKEARTEQIKQDLTDAINQIVESGRLGDYLNAMASNGLNRWSFNNQLLALTQAQAVRDELPDDDPDKNRPVTVMSANDWKKKHGRYPKKGSKAIWILAPVTRRRKKVNEKTGEEETITYMVGVKAQPKFDIAQTQGDPFTDRLHDGVTTGDVRPGVYKGLQDRVAAAGYTYREKEIATDPDTGTGTLAYVDPKTKELVVDPRLNPAMRQSALAHELAHIKCGHVDDLDEYRRHRGEMETEAEATAYMVDRHFGMDKEQSAAFSPAYIAGWSGGDPEKINRALARATQAFNEIVDGDWPED